MITKQQIAKIATKIESEGWDYAITQWDWKSIKDDEFHQLKKEYINARIRLEEYLEDHGKE